MNNYEILPNGIEVVYAFGSVPDKQDKRFIFLAGTTGWNGSLVNDSWRRIFLEKIGKEENTIPGSVICVPEPQFGRFQEAPTKHLIEWETEYGVLVLYLRWSSFFVHNSRILIPVHG